MEAYSLLEPDACANMGKEGGVETTVYGEIVQVKQDRIIPVFWCIVIETLISQYCGMFSGAVVARYLVQGAQGIGSFGVPPGEEEWQDSHQRPDT